MFLSFLLATPEKMLMGPQRNKVVGEMVSSKGEEQMPETENYKMEESCSKHVFDLQAQHPISLLFLNLSYMAQDPNGVF